MENISPEVNVIFFPPVDIIITRGVVINGVNRIEIFFQGRKTEVKIIL